MTATSNFFSVVAGVGAGTGKLKKLRTFAYSFKIYPLIFG
jgi:hypothetical protein